MPRDRAEKRKQLAALESAVLRGVPEDEAVAAHVTANGLTAERGAADIDQLRRRWARKATRERNRADANVGLALTRCELLYRLAVERDDIATAFNSERLMCELLGLCGSGRVTTREG
jgi:hypothetical protein